LIRSPAQLKRAHSAEPDSAAASSKSPSAGPFGGDITPPKTDVGHQIPGAPASLLSKSVPNDAIVGSPLKKQRPSFAEGMTDEKGSRSDNLPALGDILAKAEPAQANLQAFPMKEEDEEEL
jgi:hypothetical protein